MTVRTRDTLNCDHGLRRQSIVQSLLTDVLEGGLHAGQHLVTQELAERYGVSHTPIREALIALAGIGMIDLVPNRGAVVRQVTAKDVQEVCQVRRALECEAVRRACGRIDPGQLVALREELVRLTAAPSRSAARFIARAREIDDCLHDLIAVSGENDFLAKELNRLKTLFRAFRDMAWQYSDTQHDYHRLSEEAHEHLAIVEALLDGDRRAAMQAMSRHVLSGQRYWSRALPDRSTGVRSNGNGKASNGKVRTRRMGQRKTVDSAVGANALRGARSAAGRFNGINGKQKKSSRNGSHGTDS